MFISEGLLPSNEPIYRLFNKLQIRVIEIVALLMRLGVLDAAAPAVKKYLTGPQKNWRGVHTGETRLAAGFA